MPAPILERALVAREPGAERLLELAGDLCLAVRLVGDPPLGVVVRGRHVVVARVDVLDGVRGVSRHEARGSICA